MKKASLKSVLQLAIALLASLLLLQKSANGEEPNIRSLKIKNPTHVLFIGNSYLYYNDSVHNHVRRMVVHAGINLENNLKFKSITISGAALFDHSIESYLDPKRLRVNKPFQVVILQGGSALGWSKKRLPIFQKTVKSFAEKIRKAGGETALYMTPAYSEPHTRVNAGMTELLAQRYVAAGNLNQALVIPVGLAFARAYSERPDIKLHKSFDGSHPSLLGTYLAATVVFTSLYDISPVGNKYDYFGKIEKSDAIFLQKVALETVNGFYGR